MRATTGALGRRPPRRRCRRGFARARTLLWFRPKEVAPALVPVRVMLRAPACRVFLRDGVVVEVPECTARRDVRIRSRMGEPAGMIRRAHHGIDVCLCVEPVDFREQISDLATLVSDTLSMAPFCS